MNVMLFVLNLCPRFGYAADVGPKSERDAGTALFALGAMRGVGGVTFTRSPAN